MKGTSKNISQQKTRDLGDTLRVCNTAHCMAYIAVAKALSTKSVAFSSFGWKMSLHGCTENVCHCLMHSLTDCIALWVPTYSRTVLDPALAEHGLEFFTNEFPTIIMNTFEGPWISGNPAVFKLHSHMVVLLAINSDKFNKVCNWINACEGLELQFSAIISGTVHITNKSGSAKYMS